MRVTWLVASVSLALLAACGGDDDGGSPDAGPPPGPYDGIAIERTIAAPGLSAPIDVVRDEYGIPHILAATIADAAFADGYLKAADRLPQMELLRHGAAGTVAELFGALDRSQIDADLAARMHRFRPLAEEAWGALSSSADPLDQEIAEYLTRFSAGVNQYADELRAGEHTLDPAVEVFFDADRMSPWTPVDSLTLGRYFAWYLSYDSDKLALTDARDRARATFDQADPDSAPALARRAGAFSDLFPLRPMDLTSTVSGFPDQKRAHRRAATRRPTAPRALLESARRTERLGRGRFGLPADLIEGSNNWVVGPALAGGTPLLANDPHLGLTSPPIWYVLHITVPGQLDVTGVGLSGAPAVLLGHNAHIAWGGTVNNHDVTDYYLEQIVPCSEGGGDCVRFQGGEVKIETRQETIQVGALGTITETLTATYEYVPHHGPLIPTIAGGAIVPRTGDSAISVRYTGYELSDELRAIYRLVRAASVADGMAGVDEDFSYGGQNWVLIDDAGHFAWTTSAKVPQRTAGCFTWDAVQNPDGVAPWFLLPGDGSCEWDGYIDRALLPRAVDPEQGFLATANADPVGTTFDGDPTNDARYIGYGYDPGFRVGRITRRLRELAGDGTLSLDDMAAVQLDTYSSYGAVMRDHLTAALETLDGGHPEVTAWAASLPEGRVARLRAAGARLLAWNLLTPPATDDEQLADSSATVIFNAWVVYFLKYAFADELTAIGRGPGGAAAAGLAVFERPGELRTGVAPETGEPLLCDDLGTTDQVESCTLIALVALDAALEWAAGPSGFASDDMDDWRWGLKHTLTLGALVPSTELNVPPPDDPDPLLARGYPRPGDQFSVNASSPGYGDTNFSYAAGPSMRFLCELPAGGPPRARIALPGGEVYDRASPHYRDLMDRYWQRHEYLPLPWTTAEVIAAAEARWRFMPSP